MTEPVITLELTQNEVNLILLGLGELLFKQVGALPFKVKDQADKQLAASTGPALVE